jgi:hypothetical protein
VGEGHSGHPGRLSARRGRGRPADLSTGGGDRRALCRLRGGQARGRRARLRRPVAADGRRRRGAPVGGDRAAVPLPPLRRRRVPGREPGAATGARGLARRPGQPLRGRGRQPDHLLVHRRLAAVPAGVPAAFPHRDGRPAGPRLPIDATGRRAGQRPARRGRGGCRPGRSAAGGCRGHGEQGCRRRRRRPGRPSWPAAAGRRPPGRPGARVAGV